MRTYEWTNINESHFLWGVGGNWEIQKSQVEGAHIVARYLTPDCDGGMIGHARQVILSKSLEDCKRWVEYYAHKYERNYRLEQKRGPLLQKTDAGSWQSENKDCTVRALAVAGNYTYDVAHKIAEESGRKEKQGWFSYRALKVAAEKYGLDYCEFATPSGGFFWRGYGTVGRFAKQYKVGRFIIETCNHAVAVVDGKVHDMFNSTRARVRRVYQITKHA